MTMMTTICGLCAMIGSLVARAYGHNALTPLIFIAALLIGFALDRMREGRWTARSDGLGEPRPVPALDTRA